MFIQVLCAIYYLLYKEYQILLIYRFLSFNIESLTNSFGIMPESQINQIFSFIAKDAQIQGSKMKHIFLQVFKQSEPHYNQLKNLSKIQFGQMYKKSVKGEHIQQELLFLFFHLDKQKKGYLSPKDVMGMFQILGKKITINQVQNSFKYAKVSKNKMSFQDFKQYFYNF